MSIGNNRKRKCAEERLKKINECFLEFGADSAKNIQKLVSLLGTLLNAHFALYNRMEKDQLVSVSQWNVPSDFKITGQPKDHICYDLIQNNTTEALVVKNLSTTPYAQTDSAIRQYKLKSYIGQPVRIKWKVVGSVCAVFQKKISFDDNDKRLIGIIASAIGVEEERLIFNEKIRSLGNYLDKIINSIPDPIFVKDKDHRFVLINNAACGFLKYPRMEILGKTNHDLFPEEEADTFFKKDEFVLSSKESTIDEEEILKKDRSFSIVVTKRSFYADEYGNKFIVGLMQDISEYKKIQEKIERSLKEKEILLREINHRVKNNLQVISAMLNLQSRKYEDRELQSVFQDCRNRINTMALVHAQLYDGNEMSSIQMKSFIEKLIRQILQANYLKNKTINSKIEVDNCNFSIETAIPVGLIVNEIVSNSLKYAFEEMEKGTIEVSMKVTDSGKVELTISDNGRGLSQEFLHGGHHSLGMSLISILAEDQLNGQLSISGEKGTTFKINFNLHEWSQR